MPFASDDSLVQSLVDSLGLQNLLVQVRATAAGRGLFARAAIPPSTVLFTIPAAGLVTCRSLGPHYPVGLDAVQLISLHLCLYRPFNSSYSPDPLFGPYISTLPREFDSHPLTCHVQQTDLKLPPSVAKALTHLHDARYLRDWRTVRGYLRANFATLSQKPAVRLDRSDEALEADFLWGWLNVNTRCVYHRLKGTRSHPDNLAMCPLLDLANHTVAGPSMIPRASDAERVNAPPIPRLGDPLTLLSPATPTQAGEELYLTYGAHCNKTLFVEYGFVIPCAPDDPRAEVDVQDIVEPLFESQGTNGAVKMKMLKDSGYWGDWTLDGSPTVSYRLTTALRLLHIALGGSDGVLQRWQDTLTGLRDAVSDTNEIAWKNSVVDICDILIQRAKAQRTETNTEAVEILWEEELHVALQVSTMYR
ncbi:hypothetical protein K438DRAFT_1806241 [Mycena galopus ATCC 62051]|nr:hypothetical protein K438DRAFT_1806241 [Mycena galopus ATCC 62051]